MSNKSLTIKRIIIFCILVFLPICVITPILNVVCGTWIFASENTTVVAYVFGSLIMFAPTVANILTRIFTKEGIKNSYLGLNAKGNMRYYVASVGIKLLEIFITVMLFWRVFFGDLSFREMFSGKNGSVNIAIVILQLALSIIVFFPAFGEELGWRGYLGPKLNEVMSKPMAILVGGVIWGLWHAPVTISGHNFGLDYPGYPWIGILLMCVMCVLMNAFLTLLTERTKSIYPASFCHMVNNNLSFGVIISLFASETVLERMTDISTISMFLVSMPVLIITGVVSMVLLLSGSKKEKNV